MTDAHELIQSAHHRGGAVRHARKESSPYLGDAERDGDAWSARPFDAAKVVAGATPLTRMGAVFRSQAILGVQRQLGNACVQRLLTATLDRSQVQAFPLQRSGPVVRRCSCGGTVTEGGECADCRAQRLAAENGAAVTAGPSSGATAHVQRGWWDDLSAAAGDVAGGVSTAAGDVVAGVSEAGSDIVEGASAAYGRAAQGDFRGAAGEVGGALAEAGGDLGEGAYGAVSDLEGGVNAAVDDIRHGAPVKALWTCDASCNVEGQEDHCQNQRVTGSGSGPNEEQACRNAKRDATQKAPRGCYARHCQCKNCQR